MRRAVLAAALVACSPAAAVPAGVAAEAAAHALELRTCRAIGLDAGTETYTACANAVDARHGLEGGAP